MGGTDAVTFEAFISQKLVPELWAGACVILDNCSIHKGETIRALIEEVGARLIYLPTYSPDFNPIENCWSKLKSILRQIGARTYPDLVQAIESAFKQISTNDIRSWFTHCCYCTSRLLVNAISLFCHFRKRRSLKRLSKANLRDWPKILIS